MPKKPRDFNQLAKMIADKATRDEAPSVASSSDESGTLPEKNPAAVSLGRLGGLKGGKARAAKLSASKRKAIAQKAAKARWKK